MRTEQALLKGINSDKKAERLKALRELMAMHKADKLPMPKPTNYVNNHIHTIYSFSPYSPTSAAYTAWINGLLTAGIMDHDSVGGCHEFVEAGEIIGIATTCGAEVRCSMEETPFKGKRINNTDQDSVAYLACHGIPHQNIDRFEAWIATYRAKREERNRKMVDNINAIMPASTKLDYDTDVRKISMAHENGSVTERHILYALSGKIMNVIGKGQVLLDFLEQQLGIVVTGNNKEVLLDEANTMHQYYLLSVLKGHMVEKFYINATDECPSVREFLAFVKEIGAIAAYAYLGDVGDSVTGDKKTQAFEDSYLDELMDWLADAGFNSVTYMPTRNTSEQLARLIGLIDKHQLFEISGEDINTPFQSFICEALDKPQFEHLITSTWALIGHEKEASVSQEKGMFSAETIAKEPMLAKRIGMFADIAKHLG